MLVDADPHTSGMDIEEVNKKISPRTKAIMPVHIYGHPVDLDPLLELADKYGLAIVEDAAEAHGAEYLSGRDTQTPRWRRCGSFGSTSTFSFYANKLITTGEGGMIVTDDVELAERARSLRNLCFKPGRRFYHEDTGYNFRLTNLQAAMGVAQMERIDEIVARKRWIGQEYTRRLEKIPGLQLAGEQSWGRSVYWMYGIVLGPEHEMDANRLAQLLAESSIETRPFFLGMHEQPALRKLGLFRGESYPTAERIARQGLYLPSGLTLSEANIEEICASICKVLL